METFPMDDVFDLQREFRLPRSLAKLLKLLWRERVVTPPMVILKYNIATDAKVAMHRLRQRMRQHGITIHSQREAGYWLSDEDKAKIAEFCRPALQVA
jgi:hypothetical protein